jgi:hypothetical protein
MYHILKLLNNLNHIKNRRLDIYHNLPDDRLQIKVWRLCGVWSITKPTFIFNYAKYSNNI